jgi:alkanesulfonate monooxygenase SsuD/methylene tetrahydromethanopterin reductase-like flavin-dependent oxidoreductase (luciferase family)
MNTMTTMSQNAHPWVTARRDRITFGLEVFAHRDDPHPGQNVVAAGHLADELGLDAFYIGDHPAKATDPWLHLAALAISTERVWLGSVVNCVLYRNPVVLARLATDLDHLSGGRLMLGLGNGWEVQEFAAMGIPFPSAKVRSEMLEETIAIVEGVWGDEPFSFSGKHYQISDAHVTPAPVQQPRPPIMIAGAGERISLRQVAQFADACNFGPSPQIGGVQTPDDVRHKLDVLRRHCEALGRPYDAILRTHFTPWLMVAESETAAKAKLRRYYPDGLTELQLSTRIHGDPEQVATYYRALVDAGIQHFVVQSLDANDHETFRLLAEEVVPRVLSAER